MAYIGTIVAYLGLGEGIIGMRVLLEKIFFSSNMRVLLEWGDYWNEGTNPEITVSATYLVGSSRIVDPNFSNVISELWSTRQRHRTEYLPTNKVWNTCKSLVYYIIELFQFSSVDLKGIWKLTQSKVQNLFRITLIVHICTYVVNIASWRTRALIICFRSSGLKCLGSSERCLKRVP